MTTGQGDAGRSRTSRTDFDEQDDRLDDLRDAIEGRRVSPQWIIDALTEMHATYPEGTVAALPLQHEQRRPAGVQRRRAVRFQDPGSPGDRRRRHRQIPQRRVCQPVELPGLHRTRLPSHRPPVGCDGRAGASQLLRRAGQRRRRQLRPVSTTSAGLSRYYVNTQVGEDLVTIPAARSVPEELLLFPDGGYVVLSTSNQVLPMNCS